ncbi:zinc finger protein Xfin [Drosophila grimshawi]|uniref:GH17375 n=1 Tax=Drosophila grimshawi TaxID=7222 RepID=B4JSW4_DROGR|nr:zinc finger protein Xfin [Drosophila grimshawi]EDV94854.1 GH17375 [Drosophila grimshawi]
MEGMDLWTSMFSADFEEADAGPKSHSYADEIMGDDAADEQETAEDDVDAGKGPEPDDDAIFDFELEPIVSIAEPEPAPRPTVRLAPPMPVAPPVRPQQHNLQSTVSSTSSSMMGGRGGAAAPPTRPTTSQINATDENGVPINYELGVIYICPACGAEFRQQDMWKRHMNQMHQYNTRRGLNFVAIDKLYHRCLECNKRIAMHSRENLLKHKFTHLPYRCTKCYICKREYKYRQDLMVHLRMVHCDEVVAMMRAGDASAGRKTRVREPRFEQRAHGASRFGPMSHGPVRDDDDGIEVMNELMDTEPTAADDVVDEQNRSFNQGKKKRINQSAGSANAGKADNDSGSGGGASDICEDYIHYMCPDCGTDCDTHAQWSQHIEFVHDYVSRRGLNFRCVDMQMQCLECKEFVIPNTIKTLRAHKFSHLAQPDWMRCKLCYRGYTDHHELVTHLLKHHHLETLMPEEEQEQQTVSASAGDDAEDNSGIGNGCDDESLLQFEDVPRRGGRIGGDDMYEPHIDYLCPQCGREFIEKKHWRTHVVQVHGMNDLAKLNFEVINDRQLKCTECEKIITNAYGIQNAQQHRITHLPYKAYARCRKCHKSYTDRKGLVKHLATYHCVGYEPRNSSAGGAAVGAGQSQVKSQSTPRKQIVTVANETYEIIYLDDEQSPPNNNNVNEENDFGEQMQADDDDYATSCTSTRQLPPATAAAAAAVAATNTASNQNANRYKCVDCGSLFATQAALKTHISEEHDFMDTQYSAKKFDNAEHAEETKPAAASVAATSPPKIFSGGSTIEQNYIYLCPSCGKPYKTQFEWRRHINEEHNFDKRQYLNMRQLDKYRYQCTQCKDIVSNSKLKGLQDHHFRHLPYRLYLKCLVCGTCYNHKPNIAAHLRTRHNIFERDTPWREMQPKPQNGYDTIKYKDKDMPVMSGTTSDSPTPGSSSNSARSLKPQPGLLPMRPAGLNTLEDSISYHNAVDLDFITYFCPECNKNFDSHAFWRKHIVEQHNFNSRQGLNFRQIDNHHYLCLECYKRVTVTHTKGAIGQLQSHKFRHLPYRSFKCLTCNGKFVRKQMFFKHLNRDTNRCDSGDLSNEEHISEQPEERSSSANDASQAASYRLLCPQCGDNFSTSTKSVWRKHINTQHGLSKLEVLHMSKLGDELYRCVDCDEQLETKQLRVLQQHRFRHLPYAAYIRCQLCEQQQPDELGHGPVAAGMHSMCELQQHMRDEHPSFVENDEQMQLLVDVDDEESHPIAVASNEASDNGSYMPMPLQMLLDGDEDEDSQTAVANNETSDNGPYMPLPPHLLEEDVDDLEFEDQYLLS